ncbi:MAG: BtrH N-terminal domain-containing protein [Thiobacillus sp.]|nr:BtrH N-terminal domain-containing protein [Thiobacillus sp.]
MTEATLPGFVHRHAAHCESGSAANLLTHYGHALSEPMTFGLGAGLSFAYLGFIRIQEMPLIAYRVPPRGILTRVGKTLDIPFRVERFATPDAGMARLDQLLDAGQAVGLQTSVFWLPYFPEDMRFHFNAHNLVVYGREGDDYLISDPVIEHPVRCPRAALERARFAKGMLAPKGLLYFPQPRASRPRSGDATVTRSHVVGAIRSVARTMLAPVPLVGTRGMRGLARRIARLDPRANESSRLIGHVVRMQEEIGTGGGGFRFLYAAFLQEAAACDAPELAEFSARLLDIGDEWRAMALAGARMVKGRDPLDPPAIAQLLRVQADREALFFRDLRAALA